MEVILGYPNRGGRPWNVLFTGARSPLPALQSKVFRAQPPIDWEAVKTMVLSVMITDFSHKEKGYQETKNGQIISYKYAKDLRI
jgi:hypothetical protein